MAQISDKQFLAQIEKRYSTRKRRGLLFIVFGVLLLGAGAYVASDTLSNFMAFLDESAEWAESIDDERLQYRAEIANRELSFATGARFSLAVFNLTAFGGIFVGKGLYALFGSRRERLLIELNARIHDRSTEVDT